MQLRSRVYRAGRLEAEDLTLTELDEHLRDEGTEVWVDLCDPSADDLRHLAEHLGLHELAVEDALGPHQRPKLDHYDDHLFLTCHAVAVDAGSAVLRTSEIDAFIGEHWLITVHEADFDLAPVLDRWDRSPDLASAGISFLLHGLLDVVVDGYFDAVETFDEYYDEISEAIFGEHPIPPEQQQHWFQMRRALFEMHRLALPLREALSSLMRRDGRAVHEDLYPYYQDVYDHILRVTESTDALRDLVATIVETNLSLRDYRQNQIMKKVTSWAAIIAVPTLITGWYGMNVPYPGFADHAGAWTAAALTVGLSGLLFVLFRRRDWL